MAVQIASEDAQRLNAMSEFTVFGFPYTTTWRLTINHSPEGYDLWPWLEDKNVLKALEYAIDKETITSEVLFGVTKPTYSAVSWIVQAYGGENNVPEMGYDGDWPFDKRSYDPDKAVQLLEDAGWMLGDDGIRHKEIDMVDHKMEWEWPYYHWATVQAEAVQGYWEELGIMGQAVPLEDVTFFSAVEASEKGLNNPDVGGPFPMCFNSMGAGPDPDDTSYWIESRSEWGPGYVTGSDNMGFYNNPRVDELFKIGKSTPDYAVRKAAYDELQWHMNEDVGWIFLWNRWMVDGWHNDFAGFNSNQPTSWYGSYFRGNQSASNVDNGVYWTKGDDTPFPETTTPETTTSPVVPEVFNLRVLTIFAISILAGIILYKRRRYEY
jgi:peptide/nickel transport system substrate-binding protein